MARSQDGLRQNGYGPLAPALFALGQHSALCSAASALHPAETLVAFLDDLYVVTTRGRARECGDTVVGAVERDCGIASNIGKTRVYGPTESPPPPGVAELGPDVWRADKPLAKRGLKVLGVPIGHAEYVRAWAEARMQEEQELLDQLPQLPDLQCAWLLLAMCAAPRANHALRTVPPTMVAPYAEMHDDAIWDTLDALLGGLSPDEAASARTLAELPASLERRLLTGRGGLTLCQSSASASRPSLSAARTRSLKGGANQRAWSPLQQRERSSKMRAGRRAPSGGPSLKAPALPACGTQAWVIGHTAGGPTRRNYTSASACFCRPCRQAPAHLCVRRPGRMQGPG